MTSRKKKQRGRTGDIVILLGEHSNMRGSSRITGRNRRDWDQVIFFSRDNPVYHHLMIIGSFALTLTKAPNLKPERCAPFFFFFRNGERERILLPDLTPK